MTGNDESNSSADFGEPRDIRDSHHDAEGDMGVSSERVGHTGPGQQGTDGIKDTSKMEREPDADVPPEQRPGQVEPNPEGIEPKAGYPSADPRNPD